jgi:nucleotide-binding universal stress UspA family protein
MTMVATIMVPLDGSEVAAQALPCAEHLARATGARLDLVRFSTRRMWQLAIFPMTADDATREERETAALAQLGEAVAWATGGPLRTATLSGDRVAAEVLAYERAAAVDLVVLGSPPRSRRYHLVDSALADHLLRPGPAPVLLLCPGAAPVHLDRVVVPLDGSPWAEAALGVLATLARTVAREVILLRVISTRAQQPAAERYLAETVRRLAGAPWLYLPRVEVGDPGERIVRAAGTDKLVVMATHGRSRLARWALGSVVDRVTWSGSAATLIVHPQHA